MNNQTKAMLTVGIIVAVVVGSIMYYVMSPSPDYYQETDYSSNNAQYDQQPRQQSKAEREKANAGRYIRLEEYNFINIPVSRKLQIQGILANTSQTLTFENVLLEAKFYDQTGTIEMHKHRFRANYVKDRYSIREDVRIPISVAKLEIKKIKLTVILFEAKN